MSVHGQRVLVTGAAGFIGAAVVQRLLERGDEVVGIDNHNSYYDPALKEARVARSLDHASYKHLRLDIADSEAVRKAFSEIAPGRVVHLAAQAGVRFSIENPMAYIQSNIVGFGNILEDCARIGVEHLVYASSSSVYGANTSMPFAVQDSVDHPLSVYAATKKSNELMAHTYSHIHGLPTTGLRFFTVYGPWGRPDMALFKFTKAILGGEEIPVYNYGKHRRDFTYIDDIVEGILRVLDVPAEPELEWGGACPDAGSSSAPWRVYNIGNQNPTELMAYIEALEESLGIKAKKLLLPRQPGDLLDTYADVTALVERFGYKPRMPVQDGVDRFVRWYRHFYQV